MSTDINADTNFYEAQAVVLSNMGQHKQALEIYVFKIKAFAKAEEYAPFSISFSKMLTFAGTATTSTKRSKTLQLHPLYKPAAGPLPPPTATTTTFLLSTTPFFPSTSHHPRLTNLTGHQH